MAFGQGNPADAILGYKKCFATNLADLHGRHFHLSQQEKH